MHLRISIDDKNGCEVKSYDAFRASWTIPNSIIAARCHLVPNQLLSSLSPPSWDRAFAVMIEIIDYQQQQDQEKFALPWV